MNAYNFINLVILSPWLIWNSFLFYYAAMYDKTFNFYINSKTQIFNYFILLGVVILLSAYLFLFRLWGNDRSLNIYEIFETLGMYLRLLTVSDMVFLSVFFMFILIFWFLTLGWIYLCIRRRILALYLYFSQFRLIADFFRLLRELSLASKVYLVSRVLLFTNKDIVFIIAWFIWPAGPRLIRKTLFRVILPYVIIFDVLTNNGTITKFFIILPWYYIYSILKACFMLYNQIHKTENIELSIMMYGNGTRYDTALLRNQAFQAQQK